MTKARRPTACLIVIGNEILSGRTRDANLPYLAKRLNELGVRLIEARVIPDDEARIVETVNACRSAFDYVFTTGGIGPTHDDITSRAMARAFGVALLRHPGAVAMLEEHYAPGEINEARLSMADMPEGAELIANPVSKAPGYRIGNVFVLAGIPAVARAMFENLRHQLAGGAPLLSRTVHVFLAEGDLAAPLSELQARFPDVEIGSYPYFRQHRFGVSLVLRGSDAERLAAAVAAAKECLRALGAEPTEEGEGKA
jgi:molybdenum cofactor synthesis domain-containing protein